MMEINWLAVLVAAISNMVLGFLWYGPFFGKQWIKLEGWTKADMEKAQKEGMSKTYALTFVGAIVMAYVLNVVLNNSSAVDYMSGAMVGFWVWLGFTVPVLMNEVLFGRKLWQVFYINVGYYLVSLMVMGAILASMM